MQLLVRVGTLGVAIGSKEEFWGGGEARPFTWHSYDVLRLTPWRAWHSVDLFFDPADGFAGWYVNFQTPLRRTAVGFHMCDLELDIWVEPGRSWEWKDREAFGELVEDGHISPAQRGTVESEAERVIERIARASAPFDGSWDGWRPDPSWRPLALEDVEGSAAHLP